MLVVHKNTTSNLIGGAWITILTIIITPLQVNILGVEAYGLVGFIAALQTLFSVFDFGISNTVIRELASDHSDQKKASRDLVRTASGIYWSIAFVLGVLLIFFSRYIASHWLESSSLGPKVINQSFIVISLYIALRWPVSLYSGILTGLERLDILNYLKISAGSLRLLGGMLVLMYWGDVYIFLIWNLISTLVEVLLYVIVILRFIPTISLGFGASLLEIRRLWRFSVSMGLLSILGIFIIQIDKLMLTNMMSLKDLGYYNLAYTAASSISFIVSAVSSANIPNFAAVHSRRNISELLAVYRKADIDILGLASIVAGLLIFYGEQILGIWINPNTAAQAALPLVWLSVGFWVSASIANIYNVAVACGIPGKHLKVNLFAFIPYLLCMYLCIKSFGITGPAIAWLLLNVAYALALVRPIQRDMLNESTYRWLRKTISPFLILTVIACGVPSALGYLFCPDADSFTKKVILFSSLLSSVVLYFKLVKRRLNFKITEFTNIRSFFISSNP